MPEGTGVGETDTQFRTTQGDHTRHIDADGGENSMIALTERQGTIRVLRHSITVETQQPIQFIDITDLVAAVVASSDLRDGLITVYARHTTAGIIINEAEPLLLEDMARTLEDLAPRHATYHHDNFEIRTVNMTPDERANGHAHCQRLFVGASETIPVADGRLMVGRWQRIFFVELDGSRRREVLIQGMGV
jgi:secondary thiamine-phosphate synthase enzyme